MVSILPLEARTTTLIIGANGTIIPATGIFPATITEETMEATSTIQPSVRKLSSVLCAVRVVADTIPVQELACFLEVAARPGAISIMDVSKHLGISQSSASRNISALSDWHYKKKPGLGLVETVVDPMEMRRKNVILTPKGKRLIEEITNILNSGAK
jgi:DNA-binding MarR family transcriptional regulator